MRKQFGRRRPGYVRPGVREPRRCWQPFLIGKLAPAVARAVLAARAQHKTWAETAAIASKLAGVKVSEMACCRWYWVRHGVRALACPACGTQVTLTVVAESEAAARYRLATRQTRTRKAARC